MRRRIWIMLPLVAVALGGGILAYDKKPLPVLKPEDCPAFQESQGVVAGALPFAGAARIKEIFDIKELIQDGIIPVLLVIRNDNSFPVSLGAGGISFLDRKNTQTRPTPWEDVAASILQRTQKSRSYGVPAIDVIRLATGKSADMIEDLRTKALGQRTLKPAESAAGVIFLRVGSDPGIFTGSRICLQDIVNADSSEELVFIEFDLKLPPEPAPAEDKPKH